MRPGHPPRTAIPEPRPAATRTPEDEERRSEREVREKRRAVTAVAWVFLLFVASTAWFAAVNAYALWRADPAPYNLSFEAAPGAAQGAAYEVRVQWEPATGPSRPVRPVVEVAGQPVPEGASSGRGPIVTADRQHSVLLRVAWNTTGGSHRGRLVLVRRAGPPDLPPSLEVPVHVDVTAGMLSNWWMLGSWLLVVLLLYAVLYVVCVVALSPPTGCIVFHDESHPPRFRRFKVPLRIRPAARWMPWKRSSVPLSWIWKRAEARVRLHLDVEIAFTVSDIAIITVRSRGGGPPLQVADGGTPGVRLNGLIWKTAGGARAMRDGRIFAYRDSERAEPLYFSYSKGAGTRWDAGRPEGAV